MVRVSSDVYARHVYANYPYRVSDFVMLFFFEGKGAETYDLCRRNIIFLLITVSGRIDAGSLLAVMGAR